jgi:hypothetical protein
MVPECVEITDCALAGNASAIRAARVEKINGWPLDIGGSPNEVCTDFRLRSSHERERRGGQSGAAPGSTITAGGCTRYPSTVAGHHRPRSPGGLPARRPFKQYQASEYEDFPLPAHWNQKTEWTRARLRYPSIYGSRWGTDLNWTIDYPRSDHHLLEGVRRCVGVVGRIARLGPIGSGGG